MKETLLFTVFCVIAFLACSDSNKSSDTAYDPNKPVEITTFMPESGRLREKIIIKGSNFGNDISKVKVFFEGNKEAVIIGVDNKSIYCLAPRQQEGENEVKIMVHDKEVVAEKTFGYTIAENVSTIAGKNGWGEAYKDGNLADARFRYLYGIGALGNGEMLLFQRDYPAVRFLSVPDNKVITVHPAFRGGKPAVSKDKKRVYAIGRDAPHTIYMYTKETGWSPARVGQLGNQVSGWIYATALDGTEEWLYFCDDRYNLGRFNLKTQEVQILGKLSEGGSGNIYMAYSQYEDCFYCTSAAKFRVFRITMNGETANIEDYAGSTITSVRDGYLKDCGFAQPNGMTFDEDGNIYIAEGFKGYVIRKIDIKDGYVSTIAGKIDVVTSGAQIDGDPIDATFNYPYDISYDGEGGFWIVEAWGTTVRKYAIE